jgi:hypothetical protein
MKLNPATRPVRKTAVLRKVLSANVRTLMAAVPALGTQAALRHISGIGGGSIEGAIKGTRNTGIDTVEAIAHAFGLHAWQLLVPDLDPANLPGLRSPDSERAFYRELERKIATAVHESVATYEKGTDP